MLVNLRSRGDAAGRLDHHAAGRQEPAAQQPRAHALAQDPRGARSRGASSKSSARTRSSSSTSTTSTSAAGRYGIEEAARDDFGKSAKRPDDRRGRAHRRSHRQPARLRAPSQHAAGALPAGVRARPDAREGIPQRRPVGSGRRRSPSRWRRRRGVQRARPGGRRAGQERALSNRAGHRARRRVHDHDVDRRRSSRPRRARRCARRSGRTTSATAPQDALKVAGDRGPQRPAPPPRDALTPFEGTPTFEQHRVLVGTVTGADDAAGTFDVRVGTALGVVRLADYERYNPRGLAPSAFAPVGARVRVSLLGPVPAASAGAPRGASRSAWSRARRPRWSRSTCARARSWRSSAATRARPARSTAPRSRGGSRGRRSSRSSTRTRSTRAASRRRRSSTRTPDVFEGGYHPSNFEGWKGHDPLRLREALANSVNVAAVRVLARRRPGERRRLGAGARDRVADEAGSLARPRQLRGAADRARGRVRDLRGRRLVRGAPARAPHRRPRRQGPPAAGCAAARGASSTTRRRTS